MERAELLEEIVRRVVAQLEAADAAPACAAADGRSRLLILTQQHGTDCHEVLESEAIGKKWRVDCALLREYKVDLREYDAVLLGDLSCGALDLIASGTWSCDFTRLAAQAILLGKRMYILAEGVELYQYKETAPTVYYKMLQSKLNFLEACGAVLCTRTDLEQLLTEGDAPPKKAAPAAEACKPCPPAERTIDKRVLTERDVTDAAAQGVRALRVGARCIVTALAKDAASGRGVAIVRAEQ